MFDDGCAMPIFIAVGLQQQMSSKVCDSPGDVPHSPLKPTAFPLDISLFQVSQASSSAKKSSPPTEIPSMQFSSSKAKEAQPNLFQYNDRSPLLFSDEEDTEEPHFNYYADGRDVQLVATTVPPFTLSTQPKPPAKAELIQNPPYEKPTVKDDNFELTIHDLLKEQKPIKIILPSQESKKEEIDIAKVYPVKYLSIPIKKENKVPSLPQIQQPKIEQNPHQKIQQSIKIQPQPSSQKKSHLGVSKSENTFQVQKQHHLSAQKQNSMKQSQKFSKTDEIIQRVNPHKNQDILIEQQSDVSSQKIHPYQDKPILPKQQQSPAPIKDSMESMQVNPQKKRRNRIFDSSSIKNKQKNNTVTPQKGVQTQADLNRSFNRQQPPRQYDFYPQIKALNVLNKLVDQINPNISRTARRSAELEPIFLQFVISCNNELQANIRMFNNITIIDKLQDQRLMQARRQMTLKIKEVKLKLSKYMNIRIDEDLIQSEQKILRNFEQLSKEFEIIDQVIQNFIDTKYRLELLMQNSKGFMISLKKGQLKKVYCILREMAIEIESLKQLRAACGNFRLERMFRQFLEGQIRLLAELEEQMRQKVENVAPTIKI